MLLFRRVTIAIYIIINDEGACGHKVDCDDSPHARRPRAKISHIATTFPRERSFYLMAIIITTISARGGDL